MISSRTLSFILWSKALPLALHAAIIRGSMAFKPTSLQTYKTKTACFHSPTTCDRHDLSMKQDTLSYIEFYSGIGGWTMALEEAVCRLSKEDVIRNQPSRIAALDHSDLCTKVFEHNFGADRKAFRIERLTLEQMEAWNANIWFMSPPCQPHTRQHSNQEKDLDDPRSTSFLHLCRMLSQLNNLPSLILCENVIGFESSSSFQRWRSVLADRGYHVGHFHLSPTQVLLPNDRPRYYCVAVHNDHLKDDTLQSYLQSAESTKTSPTISVAIPELGVTEADCDRGDGASNMPLLSSFLDCAVDSSLRVPGKVLDTKASWCFDIVTPKDFRSSCFTHSYGRYVKGTGSILYDDYEFQSRLFNPEERDFEDDWTQRYDVSKLRYFSGSELARMFGFSDSFSFPSDCTQRQQWKLMGNSLNVRVASRLVELGLRLIK